MSRNEFWIVVLAYITLELYERTSAEGLEYSLRIGFSPGASSSNLIDLQLDCPHYLKVAPRRFKNNLNDLFHFSFRWISDHIPLEDALKHLNPKV